MHDIKLVSRVKEQSPSLSIKVAASAFTRESNIKSMDLVEVEINASVHGALTIVNGGT